jgi:hypothetical protein
VLDFQRGIVADPAAVRRWRCVSRVTLPAVGSRAALVPIERLSLAAAALSLGAGLIHLSVIPSHIEEYWLFGVLFGIAAALQFAWAEGVRRWPEHRRLLLAGAALNAGLVAVWIVSRTTGLPIGDHPGVPEPVGVRDLLATIDELFLLLAIGLSMARMSSPPLVPIAWALALASVVVAVVPGGHT